MIYCDSAYFLKFYIREPGSEEVRELFESDDIASSSLAQIEVVSAIHRKWREKHIDEDVFRWTLQQFSLDVASGVWNWLAVTPAHLDAVREAYQSLSSSHFLRASDALHLVCARDHGFKTVYSNDKTLLAGAKHFGLKERNVIR